MPAEAKTHEATGWTVDTLHSHIIGIMDEREKRSEAAIRFQKEAQEAALASAQKAIDKSEEDAKAWRQNANEWRAAMTDKDKLYLTKEMGDRRMDGLEKRLDEHQSKLDSSQGRSTGRSDIWGILIAGIALAGVIFNMIHK
jgi:hypothetical protein